MTRRVLLTPGDPRWPAAFEAEAAALAALLGDTLLACDHIGSTAVPGLPAKPVIDMLLTVRELGVLDGMADGFARLGYTAEGEFGMAGRRFFHKGGDLRTHHLHAFLPGSAEIPRHLAFRDHLLAHPQDLQAYARLKTALAQRHAADPAAYQAGKQAFIDRIDALAGRNGGKR